MKSNKGGFTIIEVSLFLAITGLLFLGVTIGVQNSIFQQRYNDSVQNFVEFLRGIYSRIENVQGKNNGGNTDSIIYGKLITFGEVSGLDGNSNESNKIFIYDIVGNAKCDSGELLTAISSLEGCQADVIDGEDKKILGLADSYMPKWSAAIQTTNPDKAELFKGALLIMRHPQTGTVSTYSVQGNTVEVNEGRSLSDFIKNSGEPGFEIQNIDFCINPNGNEISNIRSDVRIKAGARNTSGIEIMPDDANNCASRD